MSPTFLSALLPVALLLIFVYRKDKASPEPLGKLILTFVVGCLSVLPAGFMEAMIAPFAPPADQAPLLNGLFNGYLVAGFSEELCKLLLLLWVVWRSPQFDEYFDGIVYAAYLSLGFAFIENIGYVTTSDDAVGTALMRGLLAVPAHFLFAVTMGYYLSLAKFDARGRSRHLFLAFFYPFLLHGTYDALLMVSDNLSAGRADGDVVVGAVCTALFVLFVVFDIRLWKWGLKRIKKMQQRSREQGFDRMNPFDGFTWDI